MKKDQMNNILLAGLCCLSFAVFYPALNAPPLLDDIPQINHVNSMHGAFAWLQTDCFGFMRPLKNLFFLLFSKLFPGKYLVWRTAIQALYIGNICMLYFYTRRLTGKQSCGLLASALWALSPTNISSVIWISCCNIQLMMFCVLASLLFYELAREKNCRIALTLSTAFFITAVASYEAAISLPALIIISDYFFKRSRFERKSQLVNYLPFLASAALYCVFYFAGPGGHGPSVEQIAPVSKLKMSVSSAYLTVDHLSLWLWPFGKQSVMGTFTFNAKELGYYLAMSWLTIFFMLYAAYRTRNCMPYIAFAITWFLLSFAPLSNLVPLFNGPYADYYLALPSLGLSIGCACLLTDLYPRKETLSPLKPAAVWTIIALIVLVRLASASLIPEWAKAWKSEKTLLARSLKARPDSFAAKLNLGKVLFDEDNKESGISLVKLSVIEAPWRIQGYYTLADLLFRNGSYKEALSVHSAIAEKWPLNPVPWVVSGTIYENYIKDKARAMEHYRKALALPWNPAYSSTAAINLSGEYTINGEAEKGLSILLDAIKRAPRDARLRQAAAVTAHRAEKRDVALEHAESAAKLGAPLDEKTLKEIKGYSP